MVTRILATWQAYRRHNYAKSCFMQGTPILFKMSWNLMLYRYNMHAITFMRYGDQSRIITSHTKHANRPDILLLPGTDPTFENFNQFLLYPKYMDSGSFNLRGLLTIAHSLAKKQSTLKVSKVKGLQSSEGDERNKNARRHTKHASTHIIIHT